MFRRCLKCNVYHNNSIWERPGKLIYFLSFLSVAQGEGTYFETRERFFYTGRLFLFLAKAAR